MTTQNFTSVLLFLKLVSWSGIARMVTGYKSKYSNKWRAPSTLLRQQQSLQVSDAKAAALRAWHRLVCATCVLPVYGNEVTLSQMHDNQPCTSFCLPPNHKVKSTSTKCLIAHVWFSESALMRSSASPMLDYAFLYPNNVQHANWSLVIEDCFQFKKGGWKYRFHIFHFIWIEIATCRADFCAMRQGHALP